MPASWLQLETQLAFPSNSRSPNSRSLQFAEFKFFQRASTCQRDNLHSSAILVLLWHINSDSRYTSCLELSFEFVLAHRFPRDTIRVPSNSISSCRRTNSSWSRSSAILILSHLHDRNTPIRCLLLQGSSSAFLSNLIRVHHGSAQAPANPYEIHFAVPWKSNISSSRQCSTYTSRSSSIAILADPPIQILDHAACGAPAPAKEDTVRVPLQFQFAFIIRLLQLEIQFTFLSNSNCSPSCVPLQFQLSCLMHQHLHKIHFAFPPNSIIHHAGTPPPARDTLCVSLQIAFHYEIQFAFPRIPIRLLHAVAAIPARQFANSNFFLRTSSWRKEFASPSNTNFLSRFAPIRVSLQFEFFMLARQFQS